MQTKHFGILAASIAALFANQPPPPPVNLHFQPANRRRRQGSRAAGPAGVAGNKLAKRFAKGSAAHPRGF